ncbi:MAG: OmpH family outer membrane protein, partial [Verrucomicrobiota bacterium]
MKLLPLFSSVLLLATIGQASAQNFKVAVVDFKKAILAHPKAKELEASLKKEGENAASVIAAKQKELENLRTTAADLQNQKGPDGKITEDAFKMLLDLQKKADEIKQSMIQTQSRTQLSLNELRLKGLTEVANEVGELVTKANNG